jgi:hypothetical protein
LLETGEECVDSVHDWNGRCQWKFRVDAFRNCVLDGSAILAIRQIHRV